MVITSVGQPSINVQENYADVQDSIKKLPEFPGFPPAADTTSVCTRPWFSDITFYDTNNLIGRIDLSVADRFPFLFIEKNLQKEQETKALLVKHLKEGKAMPANLFHSDWIIFVIFFAAICYSVIRVMSKNLLAESARFFLSPGVNDPGSRDIASLFHWQSTLLNLASFINIALFSYFVIVRNNMLIENLSGILAWIITFTGISLMVTFRHFICVITGNISDEKDAFNEYIVVVYQWYRIIGLISFP